MGEIGQGSGSSPLVSRISSSSVDVFTKQETSCGTWLSQMKTSIISSALFSMF